MPAPKIVLRKAADLRADPRNARTHGPDQLQAIAASLRQFGFTNPVLVDGGDKLDIVAGHGRVEAALAVYAGGGSLRFPNGDAMPAGTVPTLDVTGWTPDQRRAYLLADNQLALLAGWDDALLRAELDALSETDFGLDALGFDTSNLEALAATDPSPNGGGVPAGTDADSTFQHSNQYGVIVMCADAAEQEARFNKLRDEYGSDRVKVVVV